MRHRAFIAALIALVCLCLAHGGAFREGSANAGAKVSESSMKEHAAFVEKITGIYANSEFYKLIERLTVEIAEPPPGVYDFTQFWTNVNKLCPDLFGAAMAMTDYANATVANYGLYLDNSKSENVLITDGERKRMDSYGFNGANVIKGSARTAFGIAAVYYHTLAYASLGIHLNIDRFYNEGRHTDKSSDFGDREEVEARLAKGSNLSAKELGIKLRSFVDPKKIKDHMESHAQVNMARLIRFKYREGSSRDWKDVEYTEVDVRYAHIPPLMERMALAVRPLADYRGDALKLFSPGFDPAGGRAATGHSALLDRIDTIQEVIEDIAPAGTDLPWA